MRTGGRGGANTVSGLRFERRVDLQKILASIPGYSLIRNPEKAGVSVLYEGKEVARCFRKLDFYDYLTENGVDYSRIISKKLIPDDTLLVIVRETLFIIEVKFQRVPGSVDEKLQTCDFKKKQYMKLVKPIGLKVEYVYVLNDWFRKPEYRDVLEYIDSVNCHYRFNELPLA